MTDNPPFYNAYQCGWARCSLVAMLFVALLTTENSRAAVDFDSGDWLEWNSAPVTATPLTIYCRLSIDTTSGAKSYVSIAENGNHSDGSFTIGDNGSTEFRAYVMEAGAFSGAQLSSPTLSTSTWYHGFGRFESSTSRYAQLETGEVQSTGNQTPAGMNRVRVGATDPGPQQMIGQIAESCIWNVTLTSGERDAIRNGARPCAVRASAVVFYLSGLSTTAEIGGSATATGSPTIVAHPPVVYVTRAMSHARRR